MDFKIVQLERTLPDGAITTVHWTVSLTEGEFTASSYGSIGLGEPGDPFIPFEEVTEENVIEWLKRDMGEEELIRLEASLQGQIDAKKSPKSAKGLPWG